MEGGRSVEVYVHIVMKFLSHVFVILEGGCIISTIAFCWGCRMIGSLGPHIAATFKVSTLECIQINELQYETKSGGSLHSPVTLECCRVFLGLVFNKFK